MTPDTDAAKDKDKTTRLYISPLDPSSLSRILPLEKQVHIRSASYHSIETFPEKSFAYLDLPVDLARALRQKLNGSFLKGAKMRVEEARPEKRKRKTAAEDAEEATKVAAGEERRSKRKRGGKPEEGLLKGLELPDGRKIKRGWADADGKKGKKTAAKDGGDTSLVFRTSLPPNVASNGTTNTAAASKSKGKARKSKTGEANITEVKEGEQNSKTPTFLRSDPSKNDTRATNFVEGKGWVDEQGAVVEATVKKSRARKTAPNAIITSDDEARNQDNDDSSELSSELSSDSDSDSESSSSDAEPAPGSTATATATPEVTLTPAPETEPDTTTTTLISRSRSSSAMPITSTEAGEKPAPSALETLFKRPADPPRRSISTRSKPLAPVKTFSFGFAGDAAPDDDADADADDSTTLSPTGDDARPKRRPKNLQIPPATPFTRGDLDARALRSAAPTPDTAAIGRRFRPWGREGSTGTASSGRGSIEPRGGSVGPASVPVASTEGAAAPSGDVGLDGDEDGDGDGDGEGKSGGGEDGKEQNEFEKHFYEQRGEYNRAWKARKREAKKGARQTENRRGLRGKG